MILLVPPVRVHSGIEPLKVSVGDSQMLLNRIRMIHGFKGMSLE